MVRVYRKGKEEEEERMKILEDGSKGERGGRNCG